MALFVWKNEYSVKVQSIDKEHQRIFEMINELHEAMRVGQGSKVAPAILERLLDYTREHFAYEESLMQKAKYPDLGAHRIEHVKLTTAVSKMKQDFDKGNTAISLTLADFLKDWLKAHIAARDQKYTEYLVAAGIN